MFLFYSSALSGALVSINVMHPDTAKYNEAVASAYREICDLLARQIDRSLAEAENKIWHSHPVWFLDGNPVVGYSQLKDCVRLLFWSGQSFEEDTLKGEGNFKADGSLHRHRQYKQRRPEALADKSTQDPVGL